MKSYGQYPGLLLIVLIFSALGALMPIMSALAFPAFAPSIPSQRANPSQLDAAPRALRVVTNMNDSGPGSLRQVLGEAGPMVALVVAGVELAVASAEVDAGRVKPVDRHRLAQHAHERAMLRQAIVAADPRIATIVRPPDGRVA